MGKLSILSFYLCSLDVAQRNPGVLMHYFPDYILFHPGY